MRPIVMLTKPDGSDVEEEDWLLVDADVEDELADVGKMYELVLCRTSDGGYFLLRVKVEEPGGRVDGYNESAREALEEHAGGCWIKLKGNRQSRAYEVLKGSEVGVIRWPEFGIDDLVKRAFKGRVVASEDHELIRRLRGDISGGPMGRPSLACLIRQRGARLRLSSSRRASVARAYSLHGGEGPQERAGATALG